MDLCGERLLGLFLKWVNMNRKPKGIGLIIAILLYATGCVSNSLTVSYKGSISPIVYGLQQAKTGEECYEILLRTHKEAVQKGLMVDYRGIDTINLTIPKGAESIPLGSMNDFNGVVFNVTNQSQDVFLFSYVNKSEPIDVPAHLIDKGLFLGMPRLNSGKKLLVIEDQNPWVENRKGYSYGHIRRDMLLLKQGKAQNQTIMPYNNPQSLPKCKVYDLDIPYLKIENLILNRNDNSSYKTFLCKLVGIDNVQINTVTLNTPNNDMVEDLAINIVDCTNVYFENVTINGTYSRSDYSGYGICMNNIWNFKANKLKAEANWGVFGDNNMNTVSITNSEINRFDIHCYGRDVSFKQVVFNRLYNQFSSVFGTIEFEDCTFNSFIPVLYEPSYDVQNNHDVIFRNCTFNNTNKRNYLVSLNSITKEKNKRPELVEKCWPSMSIENMKINVESSTEVFYVYKSSSTSLAREYLDKVSSVRIKGMSFLYNQESSPINLYISNIDAKPKSLVVINIDRLCIVPENKEISDSFGKLFVNFNPNCISSNSKITKSRISNTITFE